MAWTQPDFLRLHPLHLKTFPSSERSRFVLVEDYYSVIRKRGTSRFNVTEGSQALWVTAFQWRRDFVLGCLKTFDLSPKWKIVSDQRLSSSRVENPVVSVSAQTSQRVNSFLLRFFTKDKKNPLCQDAQTPSVLRLQLKYENRAEMINAYRTNLFLKCRKMLFPDAKREWKRGRDPDCW